MTGAAQPGILRDGRLGGADAEALAARFGTPYFVYDLDVISSQVLALRAALPPTFDLAYATKANPLLAVLRHLSRLGVGADVASRGELHHVLRAGFDAASVVMTGPGKRPEELAAAVEAGVRAVTVESPGEVRRLAAIAEGFGRRQPVLLRLSSPAGRERVRILGDRGAGKFGMDLEGVRAAAADAVASPHLEPLGIHAFGVSNELDAAALAAHAEATIDIARTVARDAGFPLRVVDVGGGLGIPYTSGEDPLDLAVLGQRLRRIAAALAADPETAAARVVIEPGRYLVGPSGAYVVRVVDRKRVGASEVAVVDGGIHHLVRPVLVGQEHRTVAVTGAAVARNGRAGPVTVAGPLCTGLDILADSAPLAGLDVGDLVAVLDVGAYGATESMPLFLSHAMPAEVVVRHGTPSLARPRVEPETWLGWHLDASEDRSAPGA